MKILRLTKNQAGLFADMDPLMMLEKLEFPGYFALGVIESDTHMGEEVPAGLMLCSLLEDRLIIEWLYVAADFRGQGIGENLLTTVFEMATKSNLKKVCAYVNQEYGRELLCTGEEGYFTDRLFTTELELAGEWFTDLYTLASQPFLENKPETGDYKLIPFDKLLSVQMQEARDVLLFADNEYVLYPIAGKSHFYDPEISLLVYNKQEICGGILVQNVSVECENIVGGKIVKETKNVLYPVLFLAKTEEVGELLLYYAFQTILQKYPKDMEFRIMLRNEDLPGLLGKLFPMQQTRNKFLVADMEEYAQMRRKMERYRELESYM